MPKHKRKSTKDCINVTGTLNPLHDGEFKFGDDEYAAQPKLRRMFGNPSAVTWWRWRHDPAMACPPMKEINGRKYGSVREWKAWWAKMKVVA
jgi:hypothetical protein